jgi:hypothetical protein
MSTKRPDPAIGGRAKGRFARALALLLTLLAISSPTSAAVDSCAEARRLTGLPFSNCIVKSLPVRDGGLLGIRNVVWVEEMRNAGDYWVGAYHLFLADADGALSQAGSLRPENLGTELDFVQGLGIAADSYADIVRAIRPRQYYVNAIEVRGQGACRVYIARSPFAGEAVECVPNERELTWQGPEGVDRWEFNHRACLKLAEADSSVRCKVSGPRPR